MGDQIHKPAALPHCTHWIGGWVGPRADLPTVAMKDFYSPPPPGGNELLLYCRLSPNRVIIVTQLHEMEDFQTQIPEKCEIIFDYGDLFGRIECFS
jgi:hypothetical protein